MTRIGDGAGMLFTHSPSPATRELPPGRSLWVEGTRSVRSRGDDERRTDAGCIVCFANSDVIPYDDRGDWTDSCSRGDGTNLTVMRHSYITCVAVRMVRGVCFREGEPLPYGDCGRSSVTASLVRDVFSL